MTDIKPTAVTDEDSSTPWVMREPAEVPEGEEANNPIGLLILAGLLAWLWFAAGVGAFAFVMALVVMIFLHELGHFMTARWTGMKATQFFIGMGPRIWSFRRGETEYGLRAIPAGAFVRIIGMNNLDPVEDPVDEPRAYMNKSYPRRMLVITAGSMMHFIQALIIILLVLSVWGVPDPSSSWKVAAISGLETGEVPAVEAGIEPGDTILSADGVDTATFSELVDVLQPKPNQTVELVIQKADGSVEATSVTLIENLNQDDELVGFLGIGPEFAEREQLSPTESLKTYGTVMAETAKQIPRFLSPSAFARLGSLMFEGSDDVAIDSEEAAERPVSMVGVVRIAGDEDVDWVSRVLFFATINIVVGLINLLPLLPLDGGHAAIATYERVRTVGRRDRPYHVDVAKLLPVTYGVVALLGFLFISTVWLDIVRPIS